MIKKIDHPDISSRERIKESAVPGNAGTHPERDSLIGNGRDALRPGHVCERIKAPEAAFLGGAGHTPSTALFWRNGQVSPEQGTLPEKGRDTQRAGVPF